MELGRGVQVPDGKNREMGATPSSVVRCKSFRQETSVMRGQMPTHVPTQDSTHVHTHV